MPDVNIDEVRRYCQAFENWAKCIQTRVDEGPRYTTADGRPNDMTYSEFVAILPHLALLRKLIFKSSYLDRRIYGGEEHRTERCPEHDGHWSGIEWPGDPPRCQHGCQLTGWLPNG